MNNGLECDAIDFFSLQCFINAVQFNSAFNLVCSLECEASHPVSDGSLSGKKASHPTAQIPSVRGNVPVLLSDSQQKRLGGGSPPGWSLGGLAQLTERSMSAVGSLLPGALGFNLRCLCFLPGLL